MVVRAGVAVRLLAAVPPLICLVAFAIVLASVEGRAVARLATILAVVTLGVIALSLWAALGMRVVVKSDRVRGVVLIKAPLYSAELSSADIADVEFGPDPGTNAGPLNWPVTGRTRSARGVRINVGGAAHVSFTHRGAERFTVVTRDADQAKELAELLQAA